MTLNYRQPLSPRSDHVHDHLIKDHSDNREEQAILRLYRRGTRGDERAGARSESRDAQGRRRKTWSGRPPYRKDGKILSSSQGPKNSSRGTPFLASATRPTSMTAPCGRPT